MKSAILIFVIFGSILIPYEAKSQNESHLKNSIYVELGGVGLLYTFNYEYFVKRNRSLRSGIMYIAYTTQESEGDLNEYKGIIIPIIFNTMIGKNSSKLELGVGFNLQRFTVKNNLPNRTERVLLFDADTGGIGINGTINYRYQPSKAGLLFKIGLSIDSSPSFKYGLGGAFGISFGYSF